MKNERPIVEALQKFVAKEPYSLHVPGHKNGFFHITKQLKRRYYMM